MESILKKKKKKVEDNKDHMCVQRTIRSLQT